MSNRSCRQRRLRGALVAMALLAAAASAAPAQGVDRSPQCNELMPDDLLRICRVGRLTVARYNGERPPFFHEDPKKGWIGFDIDLGMDIAAKLGVAYAENLSANSFDEVVDLVARGQADVGISKLSSTLSRAMRIRFTNPYVTVYQTVLVNRLAAPTQQDPFVTLNEAGFRIGALEGSSYVGYAKNSFPRAEVVGYLEFATMMDDVTRGRLGAVFVDSAHANTWRRQNPQRLIQVRTFVDRERRDPLAIAVGWQDTHLLAWLNQYLERIRVDGSAEALFRKWFVDSVSGSRPETGAVKGE